jgi:inosine/xanthosine triphosphatase
MRIMKIGIGSANPAKIKAAQPFIDFFEKAELISYNSDSLVSDQPFSDEETKKGAMNRALDCVSQGAAIGIGLEGGVMEMQDGIYLCNWGAVADTDGNILTAAGARILLPPSIASGLRNGTVLGELMSKMTNDPEIRKKDGAIGVFTRGMLSRGEMFLHISTILLGQYQYLKEND